MSDAKNYMIGQRVIYGRVICTVCKPERNDGNIWIDNPEKGHKHWVSRHNLTPLPNGQL